MAGPKEGKGARVVVMVGWEFLEVKTAETEAEVGMGDGQEATASKAAVAMAMEVVAEEADPQEGPVGSEAGVKAEMMEAAAEAREMAAAAREVVVVGQARKAR